MCFSFKKYAYAWIIDSDFSYHMMLHQEWFTTFRSGNFAFIYLGDDKACTIARMG